MLKQVQDGILRVTAGVIRRNGRILIARRKGPGALAGLWEFPGGKLEPGERPAEGLARELQEELGLTGTIGPLLHRARHQSGSHTIELSFYRVIRPRGRVRLRDHTTFAWVRPLDLSTYPWVPADAAFASQLARSSGSLIATEPMPRCNTDGIRKRAGQPVAK